MANWGTQLPVYVTRENANGYVGTFYLAAWMAIIVLYIFWINVILWGGIGIYEAVTKII